MAVFVPAVSCPVPSHSCHPVIITSYYTLSASSQWCGYTSGLLGGFHACSPSSLDSSSLQGQRYGSVVAASVFSVTSLLWLFVCTVGSIASRHPWGTVLAVSWISCHHLLLKAVHFHHHHPGFLGSASSRSSFLLQSLILLLSACLCNPFASPFHRSPAPVHNPCTTLIFLASFSSQHEDTPSGRGRSFTLSFLVDLCFQSAPFLSLFQLCMINHLIINSFVHVFKGVITAFSFFYFVLFSNV